MSTASARPVPVGAHGLVNRLRWTAVAAASFLLFAPAVVLLVLSLLAAALAPVGVGLLLARAVVPATERLTGLHRRLSGSLLGEELPAGYAPGGPLVWLRDRARRRDVSFLAFSVSGGAVLSGLVPLLLVTPFVHLGAFVITHTGLWFLLFLLSLAGPPIWWFAAPPLVRARALVDRRLLGHTRVEELEQRVAESLDHNAAEVRRIERDLHDGAQARIASVGMNVGLAEKLIATDPEAAAALLREARESTVSALEDLRSVVRGIHPPALADRGLAGGLEALALPIPLPVTLSVVTPPRLPEPVESAAYFAVAECLANTVKHAGAARAWVRVHHDGQRLHLVVGDDGRGGADPTGTGLAGIARRLAAFDGTMVVESPPGGPTEVRMEVPCPTGS